MSERRPLAGVRVLECAEGLPGPVAGWLLAEAGAEVVKVEPSGGDRLRGDPGFRVVNRGKTGVVLDAEDSEHRERLRRIMAAADVIIVDETEARLEKLGAGYDAARAPALVWCA
ncbi:MAG: CoA transferase, partial [Candidatus Binatia bacterium]